EYVDAVAAVKAEPVGTQWDIPTKRTAFLILLVAGAGILWISRPVIPLLLVSGILSYFLSPIVDLAHRLRIPRGVSTIVLYLLVLLGVVLLPVVLVPVLLQQLRVITNFDVNRTAAAFLLWLTERINSIPPTIFIWGFPVPLGERVQDLQQNFAQYVTLPNLTDILNSLQQLVGTATSVVGSTAYIGISVVGTIVQVFVLSVLTFFMSLYLTKDSPQIREYVQGLFPRSFQPELAELIRRISGVWTAFFRGQLLLCLTIGVLTWLALELIGMPGALILAIVAGAMEVIPNLGPTLATIPAIIVALLQGSNVLGAYGVNNLGFALITVAVYFIIQQLENTIIVPRVIGSSVNLHPIVIICGVIVGFNLAGIWGAFFAAPVIASLRIVAGYVHAKLLDYPPFHGEPLPPPSRRRVHTYRRTITGDQMGNTPPRPSGTGAQAAPEPHLHDLANDDK
ncbi:MAG TPA: AI-2E family transporter, partial [Caldilineaceae bacterium]|nr:AI-2E family transporter [Caldilineaceae bacterium]